MNSQPFVSVLMPVFNGAAYVKESIESILNQTYTNFEFIIVNDGSTDSTEDIIKSIDDPRIILENNPQNLGVIASLNRGLDLIKGKYIVRIDADDISFPDRIEKQIEYLEANLEVGLIGSWFEKFGENIESTIIKYKTDDTEIRIQHLYQDQVAAPSTIFRSSVLHENQLRYNPQYYSAEDYDFHVELSRHCKQYNLPILLTRKRDHPQNTNNLRPHIMEDNSLLIRQIQFKRMGVDMSLDEVRLYCKFAYAEFDFNSSIMDQLANLLNRILNANEQTEFIPKQAYRAYLASHFFHLCYNNPLIGKQGWTYFSKAPFSKFYHPLLFEKLKFRLKTLIA
jgi:glycosyltransferase involved in cell wall biosynthesis